MQDEQLMCRFPRLIGRLLPGVVLAVSLVNSICVGQNVGNAAQFGFPNAVDSASDYRNPAIQKLGPPAYNSPQQYNSISNYGTWPHYNTVPGYQPVSRFNPVPSYSLSPNYNSVEQYNSVPRYNSVPVYNPVPNYNTFQRHNSVRKYNRSVGAKFSR